jgi:hypothetical protein
MLPILIGGFAVAGVGIGWVGYKANRRIAAWGRNMNEIDGIFQQAAEGEDHAATPAVRTRPADDTRAKTPFGAQHLPAGPAASR